jgi:acyl dehydratase
MVEMARELNLKPIDTSDVDRWVGKPVGGGQLKDPIGRNDIRRWVQAMQNPNPLYINDQFATESVHGRLIAPQSFTICCDVGMGATPAIQGKIPGSHMLFGGDEWWFFGPRIEPGDRLRSSRMCFDYRVANTRFAGPTLFQRGDTTYINQRGEVVAKQRSTAIRYLVENAHKLNSLQDQAEAPNWTDEQLAVIDAEKRAYYATFAQHVLRTFADVSVGERLPRGVLGPHSLTTFATEWRAYLFTIWGAAENDGLPSSTMDAGWLPEMSRDEEAARLDPAQADGLYRGASRGHTDERYARLIGVPRAYGYGASMGAWVLDYVSNWAGEYALIWHSNIQYRNPAFAGDVTYLIGEVIAKGPEPITGRNLVTVMVEMTNQNGLVMAKGPVEVSFSQ